MKNEIFEFFQKNTNEINNLIDEAKTILNTGFSKDQRGYILINILFQCIKEEKVDMFIEKAKSLMDEDELINISNFIIEDQNNIIDYFTLSQDINNEGYPKLIDFSWKFIGLATLEKFEVGDVIPKILLKLSFNNGKEKLIETDFANFKKIQEEIEENLSSFNSTYSKRIETFAK